MKRILFILALLFLVGCGGGSSDTTYEEPPVIITPPTIDVVENTS